MFLIIYFICFLLTLNYLVSFFVVKLYFIFIQTLPEKEALSLVIFAKPTEAVLSLYSKYYM